MPNKTDTRLVLLHLKDNVFVCCQNIQAGENIEIEGEQFTVDADISIGHKLARYKICSGEKIIKHGVSIGSAKIDIQHANHVHLHNIKSDYIPSHERSGIVDDHKKP